MSTIKNDSLFVGFSRPSGWFEPFSWLIRLVCWSPYSHAYIKYFDSYANRWIIFQASGLKVNFIGHELFSTEEFICGEFEIPITSDIKLSTIQFAIDNVGTPYGVLQIAGFVWVLLANLFGNKVKNPLYSGSSWFCSEIVTQILDQIKSIGDTMDPSTATPKDVYNFLLSKGYKLASD